MRLKLILRHLKIDRKEIEKLAEEEKSIVAAAHYDDFMERIRKDSGF